MTRDDILRMAREVGLMPDNSSPTPQTRHMARLQNRLELYTELIKQHLISEGYRKCAEGQRTTQFCGQLEAAVAAEREACARLCADYTDWCHEWGQDCNHMAANAAANECAAAIRARGENT